MVSDEQRVVEGEEGKVVTVDEFAAAMTLSLRFVCVGDESAVAGCVEKAMRYLVGVDGRVTLVAKGGGDE